MSGINSVDDIAAMSDDDLMNMDPSVFEDKTEAPAPVQEQEAPPAPAPEEPEETVEEDDLVDVEEEETTKSPLFEDMDPKTLEDEMEAASSAAEKDADETEEEAKAAVPEKDNHTTPEQTEAEASESDKEAEEAPEKDAAEAESEEPDYKAEYERLMAPFKANGREFKPESPEEAIRLMQMGANYTRKMQALKPNLRMMRMLENHGLLAEDKISFLIDLDKKDPNAIQKLLHESQIDPIDLDTSKEPAYTPGNHAVSDQEMAFHDILGDVASSPEGQETVSVINRQWDQASKAAVYQEPQILQIINEQRSNGIYDTISREIERQQVLGILPNTTPFIEAYKTVGDALHAAGKLVPNTQSAAPVQQTLGTPDNPKPVAALETRVARPKKATDNGAKAKAAAPAKSSPKSTPKEFDVFSLSDDEIMAM